MNVFNCCHGASSPTDSQSFKKIDADKMIDAREGWRIDVESMTNREIMRAVKSTNVVVRRQIASSLRTPSDALELLACDDSAIVRLAVAKNAKTPIYVLMNMLGDENVLVRSAAIGK